MFFILKDGIEIVFILNLILVEFLQIESVVGLAYSQKLTDFFVNV